MAGDNPPRNIGIIIKSSRKGLQIQRWKILKMKDIKQSMTHKEIHLKPASNYTRKRNKLELLMSTNLQDITKKRKKIMSWAQGIAIRRWHGTHDEPRQLCVASEKCVNKTDVQMRELKEKPLYGYQGASSNLKCRKPNRYTFRARQSRLLLSI